MKIRKNAYAKVNLGLRVLSKRSDGFHPLKTVFHLIDLHDVIEMEINDSDVLSVSVTGNEDYLPTGAKDLMEKAAELFAASTDKIFSIIIKIEKHIPSQAGLGGGSSDASTVLCTLNEYFGYPLSKERLMELSLMLGSDVPFFTSGYPAAYGEGRGEILSEVSSCNYPCIIVKKKGDKVSTKEAFRILDERSEIIDEKPMWPLPLNTWRGTLINDFDIMQDIRNEDEFKKLSSLSSYDSTTGSGACQILVFENDEKADEVMNQSTSYELIRTRLLSLQRP